jgi:hypothetical protein
MITKKQYVEYLVSTPKNCTCTYLAEHLEEVSHDVVNDFLHQKRFLPREVWNLVKDRIEDRKEAFLLVDDSVQDKRYSRFIELVRAQYSGNEHRVIKGIGVVNLVHSAGKDGDFYPIDYRVYAPDVEGKTKNDHFQEMFVNALDLKHLHARTILFDGWYASAENLKLIHRRKRIFFTTLKSNRLVSLSKAQGYMHLEDLEWTPDRLTHGVLVKLKEVPFYVRLFKLVAPDGDIDWVITNDLAETVTAQVAEESSDVRWQVEVCQSQPVKMAWGPLRLLIATIIYLRGVVKREDIRDVDLLPRDHDFFDQALGYGLAIGKGETIEIVA